MRLFVLAFLTLTASVAAQNKFGLNRNSKDFQASLVPSVPFNETTFGAPFKAAIDSYYLAMNTCSLGNFLSCANSMKALIKAMGDQHINTVLAIMKGIDVYKAYISQVKNADQGFKIKYQNALNITSARASQPQALREFSAIQNDTTNALNTIGRLVQLNAQILERNQSLRNTLRDYRNQTDNLMRSMIDTLADHNTKMNEEVTKINTDANKLFGDLKVKAEAVRTEVDTNINDFKAAATTSENVVTKYLTGLFTKKNAQLIKVIEDINTAKTALETAKTAYTTEITGKKDAITSGLDTFKTDQTIKFDPYFAADSGFTVASDKVKKSVAAFRWSQLYYKYYLDVLGFSQRLFNWVTRKTDFDFMSLFNFQTSYSTQVGNIFASFENLGLAQSIVYKQVVAASGDKYEQAVSTVEFRFGEWKTIAKADFPITVAAADADLYTYVRAPLRLFDTKFTSATTSYRFSVRNYDTTYSFYLLGAVKLHTAAIDTENPPGAYAYLALSDPNAANGLVTVTLAVATDTGVADLPAAPALITTDSGLTNLYDYVRVA